MNMKYLKNLGDQEFRKTEPNVQEQKTDIHKLNIPQQTLSFGFNRWTMFGIIAALALITILSVTSVIQVNAILKYNTDLHKAYKDLKQNNELYKRQINQLESPERITNIAKEKLGMQVANAAPQFVNQ